MKTGKFLFGSIFILVIIALFACAVNESDPDFCEWESCYNSCKEGSSYCYRHQPGSLSYKQESYKKEKSTSSATRSTYSTSSTESYTSEKSYSSGKSYSSSKSYSSGKNYSSDKSYSSTKGAYHSYDEGYDDVYLNDDYDIDRYYEDDDYAMGVDDAMEDEDW